MEASAAGSIDIHDHASFAAHAGYGGDGEASLYEGILDVIVGGRWPITFVPRFPRALGAWPLAARARDGRRLPLDAGEARLWHAQVARHVVTPDADSPRVEMHPWAYRTSDEPSAMAFTFFVGDEAFATFSRELVGPGSQLENARVMRYLRETVIPTIART